jgi:hypothetical protein
MQGAMSKRSDSAVAFYRRHGSSPEVVAQAVAATIRRPRTVVPTPRWQTYPIWLLKRYAPRAAAAYSRHAARAIR